MLNGEYVWVTHTLSTEVCIGAQGWPGVKTSGGKEHDKSGTGEEGLTALCASCEGSKKNGIRSLRSPCWIA